MMPRLLLSILFVRFAGLAKLGKRSWTTFNSLCEIHGNYVEGRRQQNGAFNSLCEIPRAAAMIKHNATFLSILFVRFPTLFQLD